jgi:hypothetical protein
MGLLSSEFLVACAEDGADAVTDVAQPGSLAQVVVLAPTPGQGAM